MLMFVGCIVATHRSPVKSCACPYVAFEEEIVSLPLSYAKISVVSNRCIFDSKEINK